MTLLGSSLEPAPGLHPSDENPAGPCDRMGQRYPAAPGVPLHDEPAGGGGLAPEEDAPLLAADRDEGEAEGAVGGLGLAIAVEKAALLGCAESRRQPLKQ